MNRRFHVPEGAKKERKKAISDFWVGLRLAGFVSVEEGGFVFGILGGEKGGI